MVDDAASAPHASQSGWATSRSVHAGVHALPHAVMGASLPNGSQTGHDDPVNRSAARIP